MASETAYTYTAITAPRTIRLIHLDPGSETDPVSLSLAIVALDSDPDYESISYCWGDAGDQRQVTCNGATLSITNSLFTGLVQFRLQDRPRILWADAVCINQSDPIEKRDQVLLMPQIYSQAECVLVWLGIADDPVYGFIPPGVVDSVREALQFIPDFDPLDAAGIVTVIQNLPVDSERLQEEGKPNLWDHDWLPLAALLARPWFRRKWIVQEISLGKQVLVHAGGQVVIPWLDLSQLLFRIGALDISSLADAQIEKTENPNLLQFLMALQCAASIYMFRVYRDAGTLLDGVMATQCFECTDPRDHVYSLLSLISVGPVIQPDYEASLGDVFRRFARAMLVEGQSLKVLCLAPNKYLFYTPDARQVEGLPSWVPDLRAMDSIILAGTAVRPQAFYAGGRNKPILSISADDRILSCAGRVVDTVKTCSRSITEMLLEDMPEVRLNSGKFTGDPIPGRRAERFARWFDGCYNLAFGHSYSPEETSNDSEELVMSFARSMLCGVDSLRNRVDPEFIALFPQYMEVMYDVMEERGSDVEYDSSDMTSLSSGIDQIVECFSILLFCVTGSGRFGRIPVNSRPGDQVCVLVGAETPFIIRPTGRETYTLIGECYIDGIMDGEAIEGPSIPAGSMDTIHLE